MDSKGYREQIWAVLAAITQKQDRLQEHLDQMKDRQNRTQEQLDQMKDRQNQTQEHLNQTQDLARTLTDRAVDLTKRADRTDQLMEAFAAGLVEVREKDVRISRHLEVLANICDDLIRNKQDKKKRN